MALSSLWKKTDPLEARKRALEAQTRQISSKLEALEQELASQTRAKEPVEGPPLWKQETEESVIKRKIAQQPKKIRPLAAHRKRDRNLFLMWGLVLAALVLVIVKKWGGAP